MTESNAPQPIQRSPIRLTLPGAALAMLSMPAAAATVYLSHAGNWSIAEQIATAIAAACVLAYTMLTWTIANRGFRAAEDDLHTGKLGYAIMAILVFTVAASLIYHFTVGKSDSAIGSAAIIYLALWGISRTFYFVKILILPRRGFYTAKVAEQLLRGLLVLNFAVMIALGSGQAPGMIALAGTMLLFPITTFMERSAFKS